jgi:hypothetical protein
MSHQKLKKKEDPRPKNYQTADLETKSPFSADVRLIIIPVSRIEERVIVEYAQACGETVPELIRKAMIREATLADSASHDSPDYHYSIRVSSALSDKETQRAIEATYNKIRKLMGWRPIRL